MSGSIHLPTFGGGIVLAGSPDTAQSDELSVCDEFDIGARGELVPTSSLSNYTTAKDLQATPVVFGDTYGVGTNEYGTGIDAYVLGNGVDPVAAPPGQLMLARFDPSTEGAVIASANIYDMGTHYTNAHPLATFVSFPYAKGGAQIRPIFVNAGHRVGASAVSAGLYVMTYEAGVYVWRSIAAYDALGSGNLGETFPGGTKASPLYFRGIAAYNNHLFGFGGGASANRIMFSNIANPFKWGNDNLAAAGDRLFSDTDAIVVGDGGEIITAACAHARRLWIATNRGLHYIEGYGRTSFLTDGAHGMQKSLDVVGAHAMIEGHDGALYGVSRKGLWRMGGEDGIEHIYRKLVDYAGRSIGYWDCMWTDTTRAAGMPGKSNTDLVWLMNYEDARQIWVVIPWVNAAAGYGYGTDTVILKYSTDTGGFTRQVFTGVVLMHGMAIPQSTGAPARNIIALGNGAAQNVRHFAKRTGAVTTSAPFSSSTVFKTSDHAQFGADGVGVYRKGYLTIAWESDSEPIVLRASMYVDGELADSCRIFIRASGAADGIVIADATIGDLWLDTSGLDTSLGNATAGANIEASADYILRTLRASGWMNLPFGGQKARRATIPVAFKPRRGARVSYKIEGGIAAPLGGGTSGVVATVGRYSVEGFGSKPTAIAEAK